MRYPRLSFLIVGLSLLGAGCWQKAPAAPVKEPEFIPRTDVKAPKDAWGEYQSAKAATGGVERAFTDAANKRRITFRVPASWQGKTSIWRPTAESKIDYIRVNYYASMGPETAWTKEQELTDVQDVVRAEKIEGGYVALVNHRTLKATILKIFRIDPKADYGSGYYFLECRSAYDGDREGLWEACKAAVESAKFE